jgi:AcrR family transcriptional regulator
VGIGALYRRFASKQDLLRRLSSDGLQTYIAAAEEAAADEGDPSAALRRFLGRVVDADTHSLTSRLAGTFAPTDDLHRAAARAQELNLLLFERARSAGRLRRDLEVDDVSLVLEQVAAIRVNDPERTRQLRRRYLTLLLDAIEGPARSPLPGPAPTWTEITERWSR